MVVVIALLAIAVGAVVVSVSNAKRANLTSAAGKMSAMARYLYNRAIIDSRPYRLVIDMNERVFWGEAMVTDDDCAKYVPSPDAEEREEERKRMERKRERQATRRVDKDESDEEQAEELDNAVSSAFSLLRDQLLKPRKIPAQVIVSGVQLSYQDRRQTEGRAAVHFWPTGNADRALIWWAERSTSEDADENGFLTVLTLEVEALTGRVKRHSKELTNDFLQRERSL